MELDNTTIVLVFVAFVLFAISLYVIEKVEGFVGRRLPDLLRYGFAIALVFVGVQAWQKLPRGYIPLFDSSESQSVIYGLPPISDTVCPSTHPVKGNFTTSTVKYCIYRVPTDRFYHRTRPGRCYATVGDAEQDGCRRSNF